jgi:predicted YcjX-like family ATPase
VALGAGFPRLDGAKRDLTAAWDVGVQYSHAAVECVAAMRATFFDTHFEDFDRQIVLVDALGALHAGKEQARG